MRVAGSIAAAAVAVAAVTGPAVAGRGAEGACRANATEDATLIVDGDLYAGVRSQDGRYIFGWSGPPVLSFPEAFRLVRQLGVKAAEQQLVAGEPVPGATYADGGSIAYFRFSCPGRYDAKAVVRVAGPTRFWLQEQRIVRVVTGRAFCMTAQYLPKGALLSASFDRPLGARPPTFAVDVDADGKVDRRGSFRHGGAAFPNVGARC